MLGKQLIGCIFMKELFRIFQDDVGMKIDYFYRGCVKSDVILGADIIRELGSRGILVKAGSMSALAEEASQAYKDVTEVIDVVHQAGISRKVAMATPIAVIKG